MAKKQTRRSISVSRTAYERLKAFCETSGISMSQFVESGINEKLDDAGATPTGATIGARPMASAMPPRPIVAPTTTSTFARPSMSAPAVASTPTRAVPAMPVPMTSAAARFAVEPPPPIIKPRPVEHQPKAPTEPTAGQIFTF
jgi:hypothetical protein